MKQYGVFIRLDIKGDTEEEVLNLTEEIMKGINKVERFDRWEHYQVEEA